MTSSNYEAERNGGVYQSIQLRTDRARRRPTQGTSCGAPACGAWHPQRVARRHVHGDDTHLDRPRRLTD
ncbi:hypothetical protein [Ornithinimicrobium kibberense]|uniref:hypothetical protein n=1 Tax=Ornithinimicrobium kibberense TaxID=282060 RepID=UPI0036137293